MVTYNIKKPHPDHSACGFLAEMKRFELLRRFEADLPHIESVQDDSEPLNQATTIFRNLQDYISGVDRNSYAWEKMGQAQMRGMMSQYNPQNERQSTAANEESQ